MSTLKAAWQDWRRATETLTAELTATGRWRRPIGGPWGVVINRATRRWVSIHEAAAAEVDNQRQVETPTEPGEAPALTAPQRARLAMILREPELDEIPPPVPLDPRLEDRLVDAALRAGWPERAQSSRHPETVEEHVAAIEAAERRAPWILAALVGAFLFGCALWWWLP